MLRCKSWALALLSPLCACGAGSVHPFYRSSELVFDSALVGIWADSSSGERAVFSADGGQYQITYSVPAPAIGMAVNTDRKQAVFVGRLFRLGEGIAMDVSPGTLPDSVSRTVPNEYWSLMLPLHTVFWLMHRDNRLAFTSLEPDSLKAYLRRHPQAIGHALVDSTLVLTAPTRELQSFVLTYRRRQHVLADTTVWWRSGAERAAPH